MNYVVFIEVKAAGKVEQVHETHRIRYLFLPELARYQASKRKERTSITWMTNDALNSQTWIGVQILSFVVI